MGTVVITVDHATARELECLRAEMAARGFVKAAGAAEAYVWSGPVAARPASELAASAASAIGVEATVTATDAAGASATAVAPRSR